MKPHFVKYLLRAIFATLLFSATSLPTFAAVLSIYVFCTTILGNFAEKSSAFSATKIATLRAMPR